MESGFHNNIGNPDSGLEGLLIFQDPPPTILAAQGFGDFFPCLMPREGQNATIFTIVHRAQWILAFSISLISLVIDQFVDSHMKPAHQLLYCINE